MSAAQADAARALFATVLNEQGLKLLDGVRLLEGVLREQQGSWRDPGRYYLSVFGTPGRFPWGWRFEGHHLSLNVALPAAGHVAVTPFFVGAHPATVRDGPNKGFRLLGSAEDLARQIMTGLNDAQRRTALIANRSFGEIVASPQREQDLGQPRGLELGAMDGASRQRVEALMETFLGDTDARSRHQPEATRDAAGPRPLPLRLGGLTHAGRGLLFPRPRTRDR